MDGFSQDTVSQQEVGPLSAFLSESSDSIKTDAERSQLVGQSCGYGGVVTTNKGAKDRLTGRGHELGTARRELEGWSHGQSTSPMPWLNDRDAVGAQSQQVDGYTHHRLQGIVELGQTGRSHR